MTMAFQLVPELTQERMMAKEMNGQGKKKIVIIDIERASTAAACTRNFFETIAKFKLAKNTDVDIITVAGVGMKCQGRSSCYDLFWFRASDQLYAVDSKDCTLIYQALPF